ERGLAAGGAARRAGGVVPSVDPVTVVGPPVDDVVNGAAEAARLLEPQAQLDALDDVDAHDRGGERGVETAIPVDVRAEPDRDPVGHDLEDPADRVAGRTCPRDPGDY